MRKLPLLVLLMLVLSTSVYAASVSRSMEPRVGAGDKFTVTLTAAGVPVGELFTIEDDVPDGWLVSNWQVSGAEGGREAVKYRFVAADNRAGWSFTASASTVAVTYDVRVPADAARQSYNFDAVYFDSSGQGRSQASVAVRDITCGDSICEGSENSDTCLQDCPVAPPPAPVRGAGAEGRAAGLGAGTIVLIVVVIALAAGYFIYTSMKKKQVKGK